MLLKRPTLRYALTIAAVEPDDRRVEPDDRRVG